MTSKVKLTDAIKAISNNTSQTLVKTSKTKKTEKKPVVVDEDEIVLDETKFNETFEVGKKKGDVTYKKLQLHEQILLRPDTYIGSCKNIPSSDPIYVKVGDRIKEKNITYPEGLVRLFVEAVSNAIDNTWRSLQENITPKFIKINIENNKISVWNDGKNIPLDIHTEEKIPIPELIFGTLLTSSNYNDNEERKTSGKNGLGIKCSSIFSSMFSVEVYNKDAGKIYTQVWKDNMYKKEPVSYKTKGFPKTVEDGKNGYTMVEFIPDFKRFGVEGFTDDIIALIEKLIYDTAMTVSLKGVKVIYNGSLVPVNNIKDYVKLYFEEEPKDMMTIASKDCKVVVCPNNEFTHVSFVNGIYTKDGGVHVKKWSDTIFKLISEKINTTLKDKSIDISHVKKHFFIFIYADVTNPLFGNQNKTRFDGPPVEAELKEPELKKLMKWDFVEKIKDSLKSKELSNLKNQTERKRGMVNVEGLKDANFAGKKGKNTDCVCCITEGDSANTYAVAGMKYGLKFGEKEVKGRDYIGSLPVRGKFLNVRNASIQSLLKNAEVKSLIQAFDLQFDVDYSIDENFKKLRYGKLMAIVDADSVTGDTPLLLKKDGKIEIKTINSINETEWVSYSNEKQYSKTSYQIWTEKGWTSIKHIMKHKTTKKLFRVVTHTGIVDVTEDHSLLREDGTEIEPSKIKINETLLHNFPLFLENKVDIPDKTIDEFTLEEMILILRKHRVPWCSSFNKEKCFSKLKEIKNSIYEELHKNNNISVDEAWVMGFFWADGTCGVYKYQLERKPKNRPNTYTFNRTNYSWGLSNNNKEYLEKSLLIMQKYYPDYEWKIIEDRHNYKNNNNHKMAYRLICNGGVKTLPLVQKYREMFYDSEKKKKIPSEILNASTELRKSFLEGYLYGDGNKESDGITLKTKEIKFDVDGKIGAQGLFFLCRSLGYLVSVNTRNDKPKVISMNITKGTQQDNPFRIKKIIELGETETEVYDLETENHHFQAGVGQMIVHNTDGYHITGLLFNFIHKLFPSLAKRKGFFNLMRIPIVKIGGKHNKSFFTQYSAEEYIEKNKPKKDDIKYFKGLGTAQDEDIEEDFGRRIVEFEVDENGDQMMVNIFGKENADFRKEWITNYENSHQEEGKDYAIQDLTVSNFLNNEMILFSIDDCKRSIPSMIDGLKESQRKILFSAFKRRLLYNDRSIKVAQFSGYVAEHSSYHHGEQNLVDTTIKLAQTFVGSNNIPLFFNEGQFGSRSMNGSDAASGRYLFTKLNLPTRNIFRPEDDDFLKDRVEEGEIVEKEFYVPIVPTILVNGCSAGIGSGFSCSVPSYKLEDIITQINNWLDRKDTDQKDFDEIKPWYRGFKGNIIVDDKRVITEGIYEKVKEKTYKVTELPIGKSNISIDKYEEFLKKLQEEKKITSFSSNCTESIVDFTINVTEDFEVSHKSLNLTDNVYTSNMVLFDPSNKIKKYESVQHILEEFCNVRHSLYEVRKEGIVKSMEEELLYIRNKIKFIGEIINNTISLKERDDESLNKELATKKYALKDGSYDYLLNIQVRSMTSKRIKELQDKETDLKHQLDRYRIKTIKDIWRGEMDDLLKDYNKWLEFENGRKMSKKKVKKGKK